MRNIEQEQLLFLLAPILQQTGPLVAFTQVWNIKVLATRGVLRLGFSVYVPLASQNSHPIIVYSVAYYRHHLSHFWANVIGISRTEFNASRLLNIKTVAGTIFQPRIFLFFNPCLYQNFLIPKIPKICDPILVTLLKM